MNNTPMSPRILSTLIAGLLLIGLGGGFYSYRLTKNERSLQATVNAQGEAIQQINHSLDEAKRSYADLKGDVSFAKERLGKTQVELRKAQQQSSAQLARQQKQWSSRLGQIQQQQEATQGTVGNLSSDVAGVKEGLSSTKDQIASTRSDLQRVVGDLGVQSDLIARNHGEIEELRLRGERDYIEFDVRKTKQPERVGSIAIGLKKADVKRQRFTINLVADDHTIEKKDKTVNEPVQFYQAGYRQTSEIVVNQIYRDRIVGYVSFPKKKEVRTTLTEKEKRTEGAKTQS